MSESHVEAWEQQTSRLIENVLRCLGRKSGYFQRYLKYAKAFEVLNARGKLNIVFFKL